MLARRGVTLIVLLGLRGNCHPVSSPSSQPGVIFPSHCDLNDTCTAQPPPTPAAHFSLDTDEGIAYLLVQWIQVWHEDNLAGIERDVDEEESVGGWVEVYQEGHRLMANFSGSEISIAVAGVDTYLWASVFDTYGRWIAQSNILHTGRMLG